MGNISIYQILPCPLFVAPLDPPLHQGRKSQDEQVQINCILSMLSIHSILSCGAVWSQLKPLIIILERNISFYQQDPVQWFLEFRSTFAPCFYLEYYQLLLWSFVLCSQPFILHLFKTDFCGSSALFNLIWRLLLSLILNSTCFHSVFNLFRL